MATGFNLSPESSLGTKPRRQAEACRRLSVRHDVCSGLPRERALDVRLIQKCLPALERGEKVQFMEEARNGNRTVGAMLSSELVRRRPEGLPDHTIFMQMEGTGGQSFGAFVPKGVTLRAIRVNCYALQPPSGGASGDIITVNFYRITDNGVATFVGSTAQNVYAGWQTLAVSSLSEDTTNRSYYVDIFSVWNSAGAPSDLRVAWIESEYDKTTTDQNI